MIILVGGLHLSGRDFLARKLAEKLGYHHVQVNQLPEMLMINKVYKNMGKFILLDDQTLERFYSKAVSDLPFLLKLHKGVVVSAEMHRESPRTLLLEKAKAAGATTFVFVTSDEDAAMLELRANIEAGGNPQSNLRRRAETSRIYQPPAPDTPIFLNTGSREHAAREFEAFVLKHAKMND